MANGTWKRWLALLLLAVARAVDAAPAETAAVGAVLAADGRSYTFCAPGFADCRAIWSAAVKIDGKRQELTSSDGKVIAAAAHTNEATPYGQADVSETTIHFEKEQIDLLFRLGQVPGVPGVLAQAGIRNAGPQPVNLDVLGPVVMTGRVDGNLSEWLLTPLLQNVDATNLNDMHGQQDVRECGGLYRRDGAGFLFGPVGTPIAYVLATIIHNGNGNISLDTMSEMGGVRVDSGETRWGQQVVLLMEKPVSAEARWAEWVGKSHGARTSKGALTGWNSFYSLGGDVAGKDVLDVVAAVKNSQGRLRPDVIQIDVGYESIRNKKETNEKFPEGLAFYAKSIAAAGARPGLYLKESTVGLSMYPLDMKTRADLAERIRYAVHSGFTYFKLDFKGASLPDADSKKTSFEAMREMVVMLREAAGDETYLLYWATWPNRATVGLVDACLSGTSPKRDNVRTAMPGMMRCYQLHNRWFATDNDVYYMGTDIANISQINGGWPLVRTWISMVGLSCGTAITSDPWHWDSFKPYWRNVEVMTPPAKERTEVLDLCTSENWPRLVGHVKRDWGDSTVTLLWNPEAKEQSIKLDFAGIGLDPLHRYAVWSFWDNRYLGVTKGSWSTPPLGASASQHLCFTDLDRTSNKPVLIGSNLHIYCGASEIKRIVSLRSSMQIELTDAGARDGDLFVYSRQPLLLKGATGCAVAGVASAGEFVWRISLADRQHGAAQRVELTVLLPATQRAWFWLLIGLVAASLMFAAWRYAAWLRLQRVHAIEQERARIARDIHDDLGVSLTQIALQCEMMQDDLDQPAQMRRHVAELSRSSRSVTRAVDEVVWAVTPANDTLEKFTMFIGQFVETCLKTAGLSCRLALPTELPELPMSAAVRHHLYLVLREALNNAIQHAAARTVRFGLALTDRQLTITVADDGCGFDPGDPSRPAAERVFSGNGLANMRKRMLEIGGTLDIVSVPGRGTTLTLRTKL